MDLKRIIVFLAAWGLIMLSVNDLFATHIRAGHISATLLEENSLTYRITLNLLTDTGSTLLFSSGNLSFGDGSDPVRIVTGEEDFFSTLDEEVALTQFVETHSFPGPGEYRISYREFNRNASIANMDNSVNTPFYVETKILIDPYLGANSSAKILNYFPSKNKLNDPYVFPLIAIDPDGDSISMEKTVPQQDQGEPVSNYFDPANLEGSRTISRMQLHVPANEISWINPLEEDEYNFAVKILEWRFNDAENQWTKMGYTVFDFQAIIQERIDQTPEVINFSDTAILASEPFRNSFTIMDDASDTIRILISDNIPGLNEFRTGFDQDLYYPAPFTGDYFIDNTSSLLRPDPYKIVLSINPKEYRSTALQRSAMLWVTDQTGIPAAPARLKTELAFRDKIIISWEDQSENEAGFTVERSDSFFPEFFRIAALPANTTEYADNNIIPNRDYYYRVKAIGTGGSSYSDLLEVREMDIITGMDYRPAEEGLLIFPNPVDDRMSILCRDGHRLPASFEVIDIAGKTRYIHPVPAGAGQDLAITIEVSGLSSGIYFLVFDFEGFRTVRKFVKR